MRLLGRHKSAHFFALTLKGNWQVCGIDSVWQCVPHYFVIYLFTYLITLNGTALSLAHLRAVTYLKLSSKVTQMVAENVFSHISQCEFDNDPYFLSACTWSLCAQLFGECHATHQNMITCFAILSR